MKLFLCFLVVAFVVVALSNEQTATRDSHTATLQQTRTRTQYEYETKAKQEQQQKQFTPRTHRTQTHPHTQATLLSNIEPNPTKNAEKLLHTRTLQRSSLSSICALFASQTLCSLSLSLRLNVHDIFGSLFMRNNNNNSSTFDNASHTHSRSPPLAQFLLIHRTHFRYFTVLVLRKYPIKLFEYLCLLYL